MHVWFLELESDINKWQHTLDESAILVQWYTLSGLKYKRKWVNKNECIWSKFEQNTLTFVNQTFSYILDQREYSYICLSNFNFASFLSPAAFVCSVFFWITLLFCIYLWQTVPKYKGKEKYIKALSYRFLPMILREISYLQLNLSFCVVLI